MPQICENIRLEKENKGISQIKMADLINVSRTTYKNWEEDAEPTLAIIQSIAEKLEIPAYQLLEGIIDFSNKENMTSRQERDEEQPVTIYLRNSEREILKKSLEKLSQALSLNADSQTALPSHLQRIFSGKKEQENPRSKKKDSEAQSGK
jgi:transcriptional regulator with XRE-family HTH domain